MKEDEVRTVSERPRRKPIILIGAPSGAGKTVLSQKMIEGKVPLTGIVDQDDLRFATRRDIKDISDGLTEERIYIIECATHDFNRLCRSIQWQVLNKEIYERNFIVHISLEVKDSTIIWQYFLRIFTKPKRINVIKRALQFSKLINLAKYIATNQLAEASAPWLAYGEDLARCHAGKVVLLTAWREGLDFRLCTAAQGRGT